MADPFAIPGSDLPGLTYGTAGAVAGGEMNMLPADPRPPTSHGFLVHWEHLDHQPGELVFVVRQAPIASLPEFVFQPPKMGTERLDIRNGARLVLGVEKGRWSFDAKPATAVAICPSPNPPPSDWAKLPDGRWTSVKLDAVVWEYGPKEWWVKVGGEVHSHGLIDAAAAKAWVEKRRAEERSR